MQIIATSGYLEVASFHPVRDETRDGRAVFGMDYTSEYPHGRTMVMLTRVPDGD